MKIGATVPVSGGWMYGLADQLSTYKDIDLAVASTYDGHEIRTLDVERIRYFSLPSSTTHRYEKSLEIHWRNVIAEFRPDIIHIHGSEYTTALACINAEPDQKYVLSIQGIISSYARYYLGGIDRNSIIRNITFRDIVRNDNLLQAKRKFEKRGESEKLYFHKVKNIIGRTSWDYAHAKAMNPEINYFFCNESLRDSFYDSVKWNITNKSNFTIFLSQATYPLKGLHKVIEALPFLVKKYPKIKVKVAGRDIFKNRNLMSRLKINGYGNYIHALIRKYDLEKHVEFLGPLREMDMIQQYLNCHVFICPSSIENSPNSLGEAQLLGVPAITSYVGGSPDMVEHGTNGLLYRFEEVEMLAHYIDRIFSDDKLCKHLSENGIQAASIRHNREQNLLTMLNIYDKIINNVST
jgi:glycosyltransferase involved in cell wall biosynthesis